MDILPGDAKKAGREPGLHRASQQTLPVHPWSKTAGAILYGLQILGRGLAAAAIRDDVETDLLAFTKVRHAGPLDSAHMDEDVPIAIFKSDEAIPLLGVVPLDGAYAHDDFLSIDIDKPAH